MSLKAVNFILHKFYKCYVINYAKFEIIIKRCVMPFRKNSQNFLNSQNYYFSF